jgi:hypothetical protein
LVSSCVINPAEQTLVPAVRFFLVADQALRADK